MVGTLDTILRAVIVTAFAFGGLVALTHWAVRSHRLQPFGAWPRLIRRVSDPVVVPLERKVVRFGGNPQDAPFWLMAVIVVAGLLLLGLFRWVVGIVLGLGALAGGGPGAWLAAIVRLVFSAMQIALFVRVIASWIGLSHARWMRLVRLLTDWIVIPLRRIVPPLGPIDITPLVAYFILVIAERAILSLLLG